MPGMNPRLTLKLDSHTHNSLLLHAVALAHEALQARPVEHVEGLRLVGEHGEGGAAGVCYQG